MLCRSQTVSILGHQIAVQCFTSHTQVLQCDPVGNIFLFAGPERDPLISFYILPLISCVGHQQRCVVLVGRSHILVTCGDHSPSCRRIERFSVRIRDPQGILDFSFCLQSQIIRRIRFQIVEHRRIGRSVLRRSDRSPVIVVPVPVLCRSQAVSVFIYQIAVQCLTSRAQVLQCDPVGNIFLFTC